MATLQLGDFDLDATLAKAQRSVWTDEAVGTAERLDAIRGILDYEEEKCNWQSQRDSNPRSQLEKLES